MKRLPATAILAVIMFATAYAFAAGTGGEATMGGVRPGLEGQETINGGMDHGTGPNDDIRPYFPEGELEDGMEGGTDETDEIRPYYPEDEMGESLDESEDDFDTGEDRNGLTTPDDTSGLPGSVRQ